jgi:uncharacterized protein
VFGKDNFVVDLPSAEEQGVRFSREIRVAEKVSCYDLEYILGDPVTVSGVLSRREARIIMALSLKGAVCTFCTRCLDPIRLAFDEDFLYLFSASQEDDGSSEREESDPECLVVEVPSLGQTLDISEQVWESLVLSLPQNPKCSDECRGLCPFCGKKLGAEPCTCEASDREARPGAFSVLKDILRDEN